MMSLAEDKKEWEDDKVLSLIEAYKISPALWNHYSVEYRSRKNKFRTLHSLAKKFDTTAEEVRRKIHNVRCQYNAELRKIKRKSLAHNIAENLIQSEWKFFNQLNFLAEVYIERPKFKNTATPNQTYRSYRNKQNNQIKQINHTNQTNQLSIETKIESVSSESDNDYEEPTAEPTEDPTEEPTEEPTAEPTEEPVSETPRINPPDRIYISNGNNATKASDEDHRIFGEYVTSELRNLNERNAKRLKIMIRKAILEVTEDEYTMETM